MCHRALRRRYEHEAARVNGVGPLDGAVGFVRRILDADEFLMGNARDICSWVQLRDDVLGEHVDLVAWGIGPWPRVR